MHIPCILLVWHFRAKRQDILDKYEYERQHPIDISRSQRGAASADISTMASSTVIDNIQQLYGRKVSTELLSLEQEWPELHCSVKTYFTGTNYQGKQYVLLLFVNSKIRIM